MKNILKTILIGLIITSCKPTEEDLTPKVEGLGGHIVTLDELMNSSQWHGEPIIIAIEKESIVKEIYQRLGEKGVDKEKIKWEDPTRKEE